MARLFSKEKCLVLNHMLFVDGLGIMPATVPDEVIPTFQIRQLVFHTVNEQTAAKSMVKTYMEFGLHLTNPTNRLLDKSESNTMDALAQWCASNTYPRFE